MLFLTLAGKLHSLRSLPPNCPPTSITPSSLRPLTSDPHFVITSPHPPWPQAVVPQNTTGLTRVSLSPPKSAAQLSILRGSLAELGRTEVPLQTHFATSLLITTLGLLLADSQPLKKKNRRKSPSKTSSWDHFANGALSQPHRRAMWLMTRSPPAAGRPRAHTGKQSRPAKLSSSSMLETKNHRKIAPIQSNALRPPGSSAMQTSPPKTLVSRFPCNPRQELLKLKGWGGES